MKRAIVTAALLAFLPAVAAAQYYQPYRNPYAPVQPAQPAQPRSGSSFDPQSGNSYRWREDSSGNTTVRGNNFNTGSSWNTTIRPDGRQRGFDSDGNAWSYNPRSGLYTNTDGTICTGRGAARVCN